MHPEFTRLFEALVSYADKFGREIHPKVSLAVDKFVSASRRLKESVEDTTGVELDKKFLAVTLALNNLRQTVVTVVTENELRARLTEQFLSAYATLTKIQLITTAKDRILSIKDQKGPELVKRTKTALKDLQVQWATLDGPKAKELVQRSVTNLKELSISLKDGTQTKAAYAYGSTLDSIEALRVYVKESAIAKKEKSLHYVDIALLNLRELDLSYKGRLAAFVQDRVFNGAKYIDSTIGVSDKVVSVDNRYKIAPKLESATITALQKVNSVLEHEKIVAVVKHARRWDDYYSSGKIQNVALQGYGAVSGKISHLWQDYKAHVEALPVAA